MGDKTSIEWTDSTWGPVTGCTKVSPGCDNCYAESIAHRFDGTPAYPNGFEVTLRPERLDQPLRWRRPRRIFVNSMSDLFHDQVPDDYIARVWGVMAWSPQHTYQLLTKRHGRMRSLVASPAFRSKVDDAWYHFGREYQIGKRLGDSTPAHPYDRWPLPNVQLGVSVEDQKRAELRIPALMETPAAVRFISAEPLLGAVELWQSWLHPVMRDPSPESNARGRAIGKARGVGFLDWVITGGESGPGARPAHPDWFRSIRDQCQAAGVAYLHKQHGEWIEDARDNGDGTRTLNIPGDAKDYRRCALHLSGRTALTPDNPFHPFRAGHGGWTAMRRVGKKAAGRELDGRTWDEYPEAVTV